MKMEHELRMMLSRQEDAYTVSFVSTRLSQVVQSCVLCSHAPGIEREESNRLLYSFILDADEAVLAGFREAPDLDVQQPREQTTS